MLAYRYNVSRRFYRPDWYDSDFIQNVVVDTTDLCTVHASGRRVYDWTKAEEIAQRGVLPQPPAISALREGRYKSQLEKIVEAATVGAIDTLKAIEVDVYNSATTALEKYRKLCVTALAPKVGR